MLQPDRSWVGATVLTGLLFLLVSFALSDRSDYLGLLLVPILAVTMSSILLLFRGSRFFVISLSNYIIIYACFFAFLSEANFASVSAPVALTAFVLPLAGFVTGIVLDRKEIEAVVADRHLRKRGRPRQIFGWLVPLAAIGLLGFALPEKGLPPVAYDLALLLAMGTVGGIVFHVSRDVAVFLIDTGLMFEEFFQRIEELAPPVFTFFTLYSLIVVVFASFYRAVDRLSAAPQFLIEGAARPIDFTESLYFSVVTLSTVGYGDIVPHAPAVRFLAAVEVVLGVLLLLFGFAEIRRYSLERSEREHPKT